MEKPVLFLLVMLLVLVPNIAFASWWNPITWFNKKHTDVARVEYIQEHSEQENEALPVQISEPTEPVIVEKVVEKPVTITVQDPALQKKIDELIAENTTLKTTINKMSSDYARLQSSYDNLEKNYSKLQTKQDEVSDSCIDAKNALADNAKQMSAIQAKYNKQINAITTGTLQEKNIMKTDINHKMDAELAPLQIKDQEYFRLMAAYCK